MKPIVFFSPTSPPIRDGPRGKVHPPLDSSSCVSCLHDHEKKQNEEAGQISSDVVAAALNLFPLTPDLKGFFDKKELGDPRQEAVPAAQPKRKSVASLTDDGKAKRCRSHKQKKASECEEEEVRCNDVSTELVLLHDPYKIKKKLTKSDIGNLSRLLLPQECVMSHVLPCMSEERVGQVKSDEGANVFMWDADTRSEHRVVFVYWESSRTYVLKGVWIKEFVKRRGLAADDEIGIYWDAIAGKFYFSLLRKAN